MRCFFSVVLRASSLRRRPQPPPYIEANSPVADSPARDWREPGGNRSSSATATAPHQDAAGKEIPAGAGAKTAPVPLQELVDSRLPDTLLERSRIQT